LAELAAGGDLEQTMTSEAISSQLRRLTQNWTICVQAREPPTRKSAARIRQCHPLIGAPHSGHLPHIEREIGSGKFVTYYRFVSG
jgi:hypothetical protein